MTNTMKEKIANALSEAKYEVRMRLSNIEDAMLTAQRDEKEILDMESNHERLVEEWETAKATAIAVRNDADTLAEQKKNFFINIDTTKKVSFEDMEANYKVLCKKLTSMTREATKAENKASALGEELLQLEAKILALIPTNEVEQEETATSPVCAIGTDGNGTILLRTNREKGTNLVWKEHPFNRFGGNNVFIQKDSKFGKGIDNAFSIAIAEGSIVPDTEYLCEVHQSNNGTLYVQSIATKDGTNIIAKGANAALASIPTPEKVNENHGTYNVMAEAFKKAGVKAANQ